MTRIIKKANSFGRNRTTASSTAVSSTTSTTFQTKVTLATGALTGTFRIQWQAIVDNGGALGESRLQNTSDAVTLGGTTIFKAGDSGERQAVSGFTTIVLAGVSKNISIQWRDQSGGNTQNIREASIEMFKV
jgi:hypothetical protein